MSKVTTLTSLKKTRFRMRFAGSLFGLRVREGCLRPGRALLLASWFWLNADVRTMLSQETAQYRYTSWKAEQGLPQNSVKDILQTRDGYLWFTTRFGIVRFDGVAFRVFDRISTPGIAEDNGIALAEESDGTLWIAIPYGVTRYKNRAFTYYPVGARDDAERIWSICSSREGGIWIATSDGLKRFHNEKLTRYSTADGLTTNRVNSVCEDSRGTL